SEVLRARVRVRGSIRVPEMADPPDNVQDGRCHIEELLSVQRNLVCLRGSPLELHYVRPRIHLCGQQGQHLCRPLNTAVLLFLRLKLLSGCPPDCIFSGSVITENQLLKEPANLVEQKQLLALL